MKSFLTSKLDVIGWFFFMKLKKKGTVWFWMCNRQFFRTDFEVFNFQQNTFISWIIFKVSADCRYLTFINFRVQIRRELNLGICIKKGDSPANLDVDFFFG